jgi:hypothetical protein
MLAETSELANYERDECWRFRGIRSIVSELITYYAMGVDAKGATCRTKRKER